MTWAQFLGSSTVKDVANTEDTQRRCGRRTEQHPEEVAEEWKQHFQAIQLGKINVPEEYLQDIMHLDTDSDWLHDSPSVEEVQKGIIDMEYGRAPGTDMFMAEYSKLAGPTVSGNLSDSPVQTAWQQATQADPGLEANDWPLAWQQGEIVPL